MLLVLNHQLIPFPVSSKSISLEQSWNEKPQAIAVTSLYCRLCLIDLENSYQCTISIEIAVDLKMCFLLVTYEFNNLIALPWTNQITYDLLVYILDILQGGNILSCL